MKILGCDLHAKQQTIAMVDMETGEFTQKTLSHEGNEVREFYAALEGPVVVGIEASGAMQWFLELLEELGIVCRVGHPAKIRAAKHLCQECMSAPAQILTGLLPVGRFMWMASPRQSAPALTSKHPLLWDHLISSAELPPKPGTPQAEVSVPVF